MSIHQDNYQSWLLDYLEGNLNPDHIAVLLAYLESNPQVKEELDDMSAMPLLPRNETEYHNWAMLKKDTKSLSGSATDDLLIAKHEGIMDAKGKAALSKKLDKDENLRRADAIYGKAYLQAPAMHMPNKNSLKKKAASIALWPWMAVAASLLLLLGIGYILRQSNLGPNTYLVQGTQDAPRHPHLSAPQAGEQEKGGATVPLPGAQESSEKPNSKEVITANNLATLDKEAPFIEHQLIENDLSLEWPELPVADSLFVEGLWRGNWASTAWTFTQPATAANKVKKVAESEPDYLDANAIAIWDYAGMVLKRNVLDQEQVEDGRLRENDYMKAMSMGLNQVLPDKVEYRDKSRNGRILYGLRIGNFGIERSTTAK